MAIRHKQGSPAVLLAALFVAGGAAASSALGHSVPRTARNPAPTTSSRSCATQTLFSPQDAGFHAVILNEWGATVGKPRQATCGSTAVRRSKRT